jgi:hypothetical protein
VAKKLGLQLALLLGLVAIFVAPTWARRFALTASSRVPGAAGEVFTKNDNNGNTELTLTVKFLAPPASLTPPGTAYVVWFAVEGNPPMNEGELRIDKNRKGIFRTHTPSKVFDIFVTVESDPMVKSPSDEGVMRTKVQP